MAKAEFHKHQRVYVKPVGTWAVIEKVKPHWVRDVEEPVKVLYDCGLGRDFTTDELSAEAVEDSQVGNWRLMRARNKWQSVEECAHHPQPGSYPVVVTDAQNWGGWRVPGAEYDRDPGRIEHQARSDRACAQPVCACRAPGALGSGRSGRLQPDHTLAKTAAELIRAVNAARISRQPGDLSVD
jgi:hypothetical protein